jgi:hypothetical protein
MPVWMRSRDALEDIYLVDTSETSSAKLQVFLSLGSYGLCTIRYLMLGEHLWLAGRITEVDAGVLAEMYRSRYFGT